MSEERGGGRRILIFAGTFEGHALAEAFCRRGWQDQADFCVATEYGTEVLADIKGLSVIEGRLDRPDMERLLSGGRADGTYGMVIDATHPYAAMVTENLRAACGKTGVEYVRLLRQEGFYDYPNVRSVPSIEAAVEVLNQTSEKVFLTTGAKELQRYAGICDLENRVVARVLPSIDSIKACQAAGIPPKHTVCMQGPFTKEMNLASMKQYGCTWMVTKNTGRPGGFDDKVSCAEEGYQIIVIERPSAETGLSYEDVMQKAEEYYGA